VRAGRLAVSVGLVLGALVIACGLAVVLSGRGHPATGHLAGEGSFTSTTLSGPVSGWRPVAPATIRPGNTPVQEQYDDGFETGFSSAANRAMIARADSLELPSPAIGDGWPELPTANTPEGWATEFVTGLLDINFARQSRSALAAWLVAEEAPDLMPGIPPSLEERTLYVSLLDPGITGQPSPLPSAGVWRAGAEAAVRWTVADLHTQLEPQWQQMIEAGWQPLDVRAAVEDVSGILTVAEGTGTTKRRFSMVLQIGSAHWSDGYGSVLVSDWKES
jgi:hypothetical protein